MKPQSKNKNLKIIIIGFGSIGQRHYHNLKSLGYKNLTVFDINKISLSKQKISTISQLAINNLKKFDVAIITNPNNVHITTALKCAASGCHLFIEKPLSHNFRGIDQLIKICRQKNLVNFVACNLRFHPCLVFIKRYLVQGKLGKIYSLSFEGASYLPFWRPMQDYRKNYAAKKKTGGGIILDGIHEFDLLFWFVNWRSVINSKFIFDKVSNLKIETEDICLAIFEFQNKILGLVKCDYLQKSYSRNCKIVGARGNLEWDYRKNIVWLKNERGEKKIFVVKKYNYNDFYLAEMKYFLGQVAKRQKTFNDIARAKLVLNYCLKR